jgi:thiosulfate/3-mercaptopyruvate sulfurtransferase
VEAGGVLVFPSVVEPRFDADLVRDREAVRALLTSGGARLVDARPGPRFRGEVAEPRPGLRAGHMPGAASVPMDQLIAADGTLKPEPALRAVFASAGVDLAAPIVTTCGSGVTASVVALALARLGQPQIPVYDGSWSEWGSRDDTAVVTGP